MKYLKPLKLYQELLKSNELKKSRLLGLDVGDKYVGVAASDVDNKIASPLSVLLRKKTNIDLMATDFQSLISELSLEGFIIGYPFDRHKSSPDALQVKLFIDDLSKTEKLEDVKYTFWDECFTSKNVDFLLKPLKLHPVQYKTIIDKFAAVGILQGYLDFANRSRDQNLESQVLVDKDDEYSASISCSDDDSMSKNTDSDGNKAGEVIDQDSLTDDEITLELGEITSPCCNVCDELLKMSHLTEEQQIMMAHRIMQNERETKLLFDLPEASRSKYVDMLMSGKIK